MLVKNAISDDVVRIEPRKLGLIINKFLEDVSNYLIKEQLVQFNPEPVQCNKSILQFTKKYYINGIKILFELQPLFIHQIQQEFYLSKQYTVICNHRKL